MSLCVVSTWNVGAFSIFLDFIQEIDTKYMLYEPI
jgi:hypothetical protein